MNELDPYLLCVLLRDREAAGEVEGASWLTEGQRRAEEQIKLV